MSKLVRVFSWMQPARKPTWGDIVVLVFLVALLAGGVDLAAHSPSRVNGPTISLSPGALPFYAALSVARMLAAYALSMVFSLAYGFWAATSKRAEKALLPILDILQSIPILSFLPVVLLGLSAIIPEGAAAEIASIVLIFTSQAWNLTFSWYQSLTTVPKELLEASSIFQMNSWMRFKSVQLPFGAIGLVWNSMMSWAGGWFFLMAAEIFQVGKRDFRLAGLGSYLQVAADAGDTRAIVLGLVTLAVVIVALDQFVWRPLLAWSDRFRLDMVGSDEPPTSWFYNALMQSHLMRRLRRRAIRPTVERFDAKILRRFPARLKFPIPDRGGPWRTALFFAIVAAIALYALSRSLSMLLVVTGGEWGQIVVGILATFARVALALALALAWTIPVGVAIGTNARLARWLQPVTQIAASMPATALFPIFLSGLILLPGGLDVSAILLMLAGTQWYLLFNIIAGSSAIPQDLKYTADLMQLHRWERWKIFVLPALFPYIITGAITAGGGAWNASIVAEYTKFKGHAYQTVGIGSLIAQATDAGRLPMLLAGTLTMVGAVITINRLVWRRLYRIAEERFKME